MKAILRSVPTLMLIVVGSTSFLLSYVAIRDVSIALGAVPANLAWAVPVCIDGGILAGSAAIWSSSYQRKRRDPLAFITVAVLLATSVIINTQHAGTETLGKWIAALPPLILLACLEIVAAGHRRSMEDSDAAASESAADRSEATPSGVTKPAAQPAQVSGLQVPVPLAPAVSLDELASTSQSLPASPALPAAQASPAERTQQATPPAVAAAVAEHAPEPATPAVAEVSVPQLDEPGVVEVSRPEQPAADVHSRSSNDLTQELEAFLATEATKPTKPTKPTERDELATTATAASVEEPVAVGSAAPARVTQTPVAPASDTSEHTDSDDAPVTAAQAAAEAALDGADKVRAMFEAHLAAGGDPADRSLASTIADQTGMSVQYVRRVIKPLRAAQLVS